MREIMIFEEICDFKWSPFLEAKLMFTSQKSPPPILGERTKISEMLHERNYPQSIYWLYMKNCGETLRTFIDRISTNSGRACARSYLSRISEKVFEYIEDLRSIGVVHGDLHPENVCVTVDENIYFIDFGWCMSSQFKMDEKEAAYYEKCLAENFDKKHFVESLEGFEFFQKLSEIE